MVPNFSLDFISRRDRILLREQLRHSEKMLQICFDPNIATLEPRSSGTTKTEQKYPLKRSWNFKINFEPKDPLLVKSQLFMLVKEKNTSLTGAL